MEPKLPSPNHGPERSATFGPNIEFRPSTPEALSESNMERGEARTEAETAAAPIQTAVLPPVHIPQPVVSTDDSATSDAAPVVAADDDLIEKEWVDKAKAIIVKTKDDPYQRELQVGKLQADYLKKRYGKDLGASS